MAKLRRLPSQRTDFARRWTNLLTGVNFPRDESERTRFQSSTCLCADASTAAEQERLMNEMTACDDVSLDDSNLLMAAALRKLSRTDFPQSYSSLRFPSL